MAEKVSKKTSEKDRKPGRGFLLLLLVVVILAAAIGLGAVGLWRMLFTRNDHFMLRNLELRCNEKGYWADRQEQLAKKLNLRLGSDNIFALDLGKMRKMLLTVPSIESCEISRILPDTLVLSIVERIPRASLHNPNSKWVIDASGVVMSRFEAMSLSQQLPVVTGFGAHDEVVPGAVFEPAVPALDLLMETIRNFPDISIIYINCSKPGKLEFTMRYRNQKTYHALIPGRGRLSSLLVKLQSAIIEAQRSGDARNKLDLYYDGAVVLR
jgi:cell division septal protein FtsQ